jgi:hypothetical protein
MAAILVLGMLHPSPALAVDSKKAAYAGGTYVVYSNATEPIEGRLDLVDPEALVLAPERRPFAGHDLRIPYASIVDLEYGQKAGRRVGTAVATTVLLGPIGLLSLFSKKRNHFLTIGFTDAGGTGQVAVLEIGKDMVRTTLAVVETRSGRTIEYQDDEARRASRN